MLVTTSEVQAALTSNNLAVALLINLPDDGVTNMKLTNGKRDITFNGFTYSTGGIQVLNAPKTNRQTSIKADGFEINLSGVNGEAYNLYKDNNYSGQPVSAFLAFVDDDGYLLASDSVIQIYEGLLESWAWRDGIKSSTFLVRTSNHWAPFEATNGRFTNAASHEEQYPGDTFFEYGHQTDLPIKWGY